MLPIRTDTRTRARYSQGAGIYRLVPEAVARPADPDEVAAILAWARERGIAVTPRGAGTAMDGGNLGHGLVLDLSGLRARAPRVDPERRSADVEAGVALADVNAAAAAFGLRVGPDPSSAAWATVGGMIGTNAAGARTFSRGATDRWVESLDLLTGDGMLPLSRGGGDGDPHHPVVARFRREAAPLLARDREAILAHLPHTTKQTAGYGLARYLASGDLLDLVIGSEGTLGIVTRATLRLEPIPSHRATLRVTLDDRAAIPAVVAALAPAGPSAVELFDRSFLRLVAGHIGAVEAAAVLLVDLEAADAIELEARLDLARGALGPLASAVVVGHDPETIARLWALRHAASPILAGLDDGRRSLQVIEDGCVPLAALPAYLDRIEACCRAERIDAVMFGHAGDGHVHVNLLPDPERDGWLEAVRSIYARVTDALLELGGTPAGEHGAGRLRGPIVERFVGREAMEAMRAIKVAFDPAGLLNPGVILAADPDPFRDLKVGVDRTPLPDGIEAELARVEVERRWGESRW